MFLGREGACPLPAICSLPSLAGLLAVNTAAYLGPPELLVDGVGGEKPSWVPTAWTRPSSRMNDLVDVANGGHAPRRSW